MHSCAFLCSGALLVRYGRGSGAFFCALFMCFGTLVARHAGGGQHIFARFLFLWEVSRVSARSLQSGDDGKKQIAKRQVRYENKRQKRQKRGEDVKKVNAKEKEKEKVKDSERESVKKRGTKSDAPL